MIILNFSHPLTEEHFNQIRKLTGHNVINVIEIKTQFEQLTHFSEQVKILLQEVPLNSEEWQKERILINLPSFNTITAVLLAELHGRMGYFPTVIRICPVPGVTPPKYDVAELLNLQAIRDAARLER